jgi:carboxylesterase type B
MQLPNGQIRGREAVTLENRTFYAFEGIPYAAAPIGPLRFKVRSHLLDSEMQKVCFRRLNHLQTGTTYLTPPR